ncbi:MAG: hypothetical protein H6Q74_1885 [Firmicutes bacterium]|nr:hypothetical protein [Bacillota bacterium]
MIDKIFLEAYITVNKNILKPMIKKSRFCAGLLQRVAGGGIATGKP